MAPSAISAGLPACARIRTVEPVKRSRPSWTLPRTRSKNTHVGERASTAAHSAGVSASGPTRTCTSRCSSARTASAARCASPPGTGPSLAGSCADEGGVPCAVRVGLLWSLARPPTGSGTVPKSANSVLRSSPSKRQRVPREVSEETTGAACLGLHRKDQHPNECVCGGKFAMSPLDALIPYASRQQRDFGPAPWPDIGRRRRERSRPRRR
jgi:hypothetical protein